MCDGLMEVTRITLRAFLSHQGYQCFADPKGDGAVDQEAEVRQDCASSYCLPLDQNGVEFSGM